MILVQGCGFTPIYKQNNLVSSQMRSVGIAAMPGKNGHVFRNQLIDSINGGQSTNNPKYRLVTKLEIEETPSLIQPSDETTRSVIIIKSPFNLLDLSTGKIIYYATSKIIASYNTSLSEYATIITKQDTIMRATQQLAENIRLLVSAYLAINHK